ncbi:hypothetical protein EVAR_102762_1 [Eumeta japonica]|uniref:Uncharacterized protein n=1 Tax=Eumeta variegata TaxID=151549 RepID=A0A4C1TJ21_EUMVA|nr:hypothetical protein EVAR_102762_1 [Eumeta japonica]
MRTTGAAAAARPPAPPRPPRQLMNNVTGRLRHAAHAAPAQSMEASARARPPPAALSAHFCLKSESTCLIATFVLDIKILHKEIGSRMILWSYDPPSLCLFTRDSGGRLICAAASRPINNRGRRRSGRRLDACPFT